MPKTVTVRTPGDPKRYRARCTHLPDGIVVIQKSDGSYSMEAVDHNIMVTKVDAYTNGSHLDFQLVRVTKHHDPHEAGPGCTVVPGDPSGKIVPEQWLSFAGDEVVGVFYSFADAVAWTRKQYKLRPGLYRRTKVQEGHVKWTLKNPQPESLEYEVVQAKLCELEESA